MSRVLLPELIAKYKQQTGNDLSDKEIADGSGMSPSTVGRLRKGWTGRVDLETLTRLYVYFHGLGLDIDERDILTLGTGEEVRTLETAS